LARRKALSEDIRKVGLALLIASLLGGFLEGTVPVNLTISGLGLGAGIWFLGIFLTKEEGEG
jgi:hypothetical protein